MPRRVPLAVAILSALLVSSADAEYHLAVIDEVMSGFGADPQTQYVEIRMLAPGQTVLTGSRIAFFNCDGTSVVASTVLDHDIQNGGTDLRWLMATDEFAAAPGGIAPDFPIPAGMSAPDRYPCGMVCWGKPTMQFANPASYVDCVAYGGYTGSGGVAPPPFASVTASAPGDGAMSLTRVGATTFELRPPTPTNNAGDIGLGGSATTTTTTPAGGTTTTLGVTTTTFPPGVGQTVSGKRLLLKAGARPGKKALAVLARDTSITLGDPRATGGSLHVFTVAGDAFDGTYPLAAASWKPIGKPSAIKGYRFRSASGPIKLVIVKQGKLVKIVGKGAQLTQSLAADPRPVGVALATGAERYCMSFGGSVTFKPGKRFLASGAPAPAACP